MKQYKQSTYGGPRVKGCDYSFTLRDVIPAMLINRAMTISEIATEAGRTFSVTRRLIHQMHAAKKIHITTWRRSARGPMKPAFTSGQGDDAMKPDCYTAQERVRRYRATEKGKEKNKECKERYQKSHTHKMYEKAVYARRKYEKKGLAAIDPLLAAIMGIR